MRHVINALAMTGFLMGCSEGNPKNPGQSDPRPGIRIHVDPPTDGGPVDGPPEDPPGNKPGSESGPAGSCNVAEVEPNDDTSQANALGLGELFCGGFGSENDVDVVHLGTVEPGWVRVHIIAQSLFSHARPMFFVYSTDGEYGGHFEALNYEEDIDVAIWVDETRDLSVMVMNENYTHGEHAYWRIQVDPASAPTTWSEVEPDDHHTRENAAPIERSSRIWGQVDPAQLSDWYVVDVDLVPTTLEIDLEALALGSPLVAELVVEGPDGTEWAYATGDASLSIDVDEPGEVRISVGACCDLSSRKGGVPYWYVLTVD